ncbi:uncharacterized protein PSFLO_06634 [Pseudozyma flocculosa]|uniref:Uncharacterized protein n=1 Tax=Pseudozyma flocculosa TaxID=84751 RepID=A0A5C3F9R4_9BASI|nr:uncharacterized protein PSFLO_06634 [Pseudozyma flocculosa]
MLLTIVCQPQRSLNPSSLPRASLSGGQAACRGSGGTGVRTSLGYHTVDASERAELRQDRLDRVSTDGRCVGGRARRTYGRGEYMLTMDRPSDTNLDLMRPAGPPTCMSWAAAAAHGISQAHLQQRHRVGSLRGPIEIKAVCISRRGPPSCVDEIRTMKGDQSEQRRCDDRARSVVYRAGLRGWGMEKARVPRALWPGGRPDLPWPGGGARLGPRHRSPSSDRGRVTSCRATLCAALAGGALVAPACPFPPSERRPFAVVDRQVGLLEVGPPRKRRRVTQHKTGRIPKSNAQGKAFSARRLAAPFGIARSFSSSFPLPFQEPRQGSGPSQEPEGSQANVPPHLGDEDGGSRVRDHRRHRHARGTGRTMMGSSLCQIFIAAADEVGFPIAEAARTTTTTTTTTAHLSAPRFWIALPPLLATRRFKDGRCPGGLRTRQRRRRRRRRRRQTYASMRPGRSPLRPASWNDGARGIEAFASSEPDCPAPSSSPGAAACREKRSPEADMTPTPPPSMSAQATMANFNDGGQPSRGFQRLAGTVPGPGRRARPTHAHTPPPGYPRRTASCRRWRQTWLPGSGSGSLAVERLTPELNPSHQARNPTSLAPDFGLLPASGCPPALLPALCRPAACQQRHIPAAFELVTYMPIDQQRQRRSGHLRLCIDGVSTFHPPPSPRLLSLRCFASSHLIPSHFVLAPASGPSPPPPVSASSIVSLTRRLSAHHHDPPLILPATTTIAPAAAAATSSTRPSPIWIAHDIQLYNRLASLHLARVSHRRRSLAAILCLG